VLTTVLAARDGRAEALGLDAGHPDDRAAEQPAVVGVDALDAVLAQLTVAAAQGHHRRAQGGHQLVQVGLVARVAGDGGSSGGAEAVSAAHQLTSHAVAATLRFEGSNG
jgi:hypothetical protein